MRILIVSTLLLSGCTISQWAALPGVVADLEEAFVAPTVTPTPEPTIDSVSSGTWTDHDGVKQQLPADFGTLDCTKATKFFGDGKPGWLWKPKSDTGPGPVLLVPGKFKKYNDVKLCFANRPKRPCIPLNEHSLGNPDGAYPRHHYRNRFTALPPKGNFVVHLGECRIPVGRVRID